MDDNISLTEIISTDVFRKLKSMNLIDETELRNIQLRNDYQYLRKKHPASDCIAVLMEKYALSDAAINSILFRKNH